jgi:RNA polymerase sigma-70 factor (ECF subfamily)
VTDASAYERSYDAIHRFVRRRTRGDHADDLTQEVFADAAEALAQARVTAPPSLAWLYTVARRRLIDAERKRSVEPVPLEAAGEPTQPVPRYGPAIVDALVEAVRQLPDAQRPVVVGKVFEGRSFAEIASDLQISDEAARMRFSRGLTRLREELERKGVTP